jgi:hypothetical protein
MHVHIEDNIYSEIIPDRTEHQFRSRRSAYAAQMCLCIPEGWQLVAGG